MKIKLFTLVAALTLCLISTPALAYIDPGMGSMAVQAIIAAIAGVGVTIRLFWQKLRYWLFGNSKNSNKNIEPTSDQVNLDS